MLNLLTMKYAPFELLRVLIAVGESRNFLEAAEKLQVSQAAVSLKLKDLQARQPLPIFTLEGKRKVLTHYGRSLYELAKKGAVALEREIEDLHRVYSSENLLTVRIAGRHEVLEYMTPYFDFAGKIELVGASSQEALDRLLRHEVDIAISYSPPDSAELIAKKAFSSKVYFGVHEKFLKKRKLNLSLIQDQDFLLKTPCISYLRDGHLIADLAEHAGVAFSSLDVRYVSEDWRTVQYLIEQGAGYGILPGYVQVHSSEIQRIEVPGNILRHLDFFAIYESGLKKINAFHSLLAFSKIPKA
jgi:DNA-binding transcriptional LysR family regulator